MKKIFITAILIISALAFYIGRSNHTLVSVFSEEESSRLISVDTTSEQTQIPSRAEMVMKAISRAYQDRVSPAEFRDGDWAFLLDGTWYYYAEGRILPEEHRNRVSEYTGLIFYNYPKEQPEWTPPSPEYAERMREMTERFYSGSRQVIGRPTYFFDTLWQSHNRQEAYEQLKTISFLGHRLNIHMGIVDKLSFVNDRILREAVTNTSVSNWIESIGTVDGWGWRDIASSVNRSFHSYGLAIDILPKNLGGLQTYWVWTSQHTPEWWNVPYSSRYQPPNEVIQAFESYGFIWGGKWPHFDTMHFEYRPEVFILSNIPMAESLGL